MLDLAASVLLLMLLTAVAAAPFGMLCSEAPSRKLTLLDRSGCNSTKRSPGLRLLPLNNHRKCQY